MTVHSKVEPVDLVEAVRGKIAAIPDSVATGNLTIQEGIADPRVIQVYLSEFEGSPGSQTDRNTFGNSAKKPLRKRRYVVRVVVYSQSRAQLGENITAAQLDCYSVIQILEAQDDNPPFDLSGVHTFKWSGKLGILEYAKVEYWGSTFELEFMCH
jgi:hypothetical protein